MLKRDLEAVGIPYQDDVGKYADFHSLRHTFASVLDKAKLTLKERQTLLRHSTIALTMDIYTHIGLHDERQGIDKMPSLPSISGNRAEDSESAMLKTGTDGFPIQADKIAYKKLAKNAYFDRNQLSSNVTSGGAETAPSDQKNDRRKSMHLEGLGTLGQGLSSIDSGGKDKWAGADLNRRHTDFQSVALPTELPARQDHVPTA